MKTKNILSFLLASSMLFAGCQEDELTYKNPADVSTLLVYGCLTSDEEFTFPSEINPEEGTIVVQIPYYISDTEEIMADLTSMKLRAQLPTGARFSPSLEGIHDLTVPFHTVYSDHQGYTRQFAITAEAVKSKDSKLKKVYFVDMPNATVSISEPASEGENGKIVIYKTSAIIDMAMEKTVVEASPWATVECEGLDESTGIIDLSAHPSITVIAQNGVDRTTYDILMDNPSFKDFGLGYCSPLFGFQIYTDNPYGFEKDANKTIAVVGNYLIFSNAKDVNNMVVLNRFSGEKVDLTINTTGLPTDRSFFAITSDDAGHLLAVTFTSTKPATETAAKDVRMWAWTDGLESEPKALVYANITGGYFADLGSHTAANREIGYTLKCKGDITGEAVVTMACAGALRPIILQFTDGKAPSKAYIEWGGGIASMWNATNVVPLTTHAPYSYIWHTGNFRGNVVYVPAGTESNRGVTLNAPNKHWWISPGTIHSVAYTEFNGLHLLAALNRDKQSGGAGRFYLTDLTANPDANAMTTGFIFDSREGDLTNGDEAHGGPKGTGYAVTGMTSPYSFVSGKQTLDGDAIGSETADIAFGKSADGSSVQLYMFVPGNGVIAYELTKFDL